MRNLAIIALAVSLAACSSPPKPPTVDGSKRSGINDTETASVLSMKADLAAMQQRVTDLEARPTVKPSPPAPVLPLSQTVSVNFPFNSADFKPSQAQKAALLPLLAKAKRVEIRGRTDGQNPSNADEKIALNRALAAQRFLIDQGVSPSIISINYVSAGDYVANNFSEIGRSLNRRVDIVMFR